MPDDPEFRTNLKAMLPELREGLEMAAERRVRRSYPFWRVCELLVLVLVFAGLVVWFIADSETVRSGGCAASILCFGIAVGMGFWWRQELRREMGEVLRDPQRCLTCGYPLYGLEGPRCPECGEPFLRSGD